MNILYCMFSAKWHRNWLASLLWLIVSLTQAYALPIYDPYGDNPQQLRIQKCIDGTIANLTASEYTITPGQTVNLSWSVKAPRGCAMITENLTLNAERYGIVTQVQANGSTTTPPLLASITYRLYFSSSQGSYALASNTVKVDLPNPVYINSDSLEQKRMLEQALGEGYKTVLLAPGLNLDLSYFPTIRIAKNTILTSTAPRTTSHLGPRIFVTKTRTEGSALFLIRGNNVKISGFRLEGPTSNIGSGDERKEFGIKVFPDKQDESILLDTSSQQLRDIEISNMELYHWSGGAISVADNNETYKPHGRMSLANASGINIIDNYIHHNRHYNGFGYGVDVEDGGYAFIQKNVFLENRHAISGNSKSDDGLDFSGYILRDNLVLPGGGLHCSDETTKLVCWRTHQIDMHGDVSTNLGGPHCCGTAGETMLIERNTVLYDGSHYYDYNGQKKYNHGYAIKIRGNPKNKVYIDDNVFAHDNSSLGIHQNGDGNGLYDGTITNPITVTTNNRWGAKPLNNIVKCDFTGDGLPDDFMATGVTWWVKSAVTGQWKFLNAKYEKQDQLIVQDFDGDGVCDVVLKPQNPLNAPYIYAKSGVGNWINLSKKVVNINF
ncbi:MAG: hypothetical protein ABL933_13445 [Methyloglobulus sp.]